MAATALFAGFLLQSACGKEKSSSILELPIQYAYSRPVPNTPIVKASVMGREIFCLLDTGGNGHLLDTDFAHRLGLRGSPEPQPAWGYAGNAQPIEKLPPVVLDFGPWKRKFDDAEALHLDFADRDVFVSLSPQCLATPGSAVVLDLHSSRLLVINEMPRDFHQWLETEFPHYHFEAFKRLVGHMDPNDPDKACDMVLQGSLAGRASGTLLFDTGSPDVVFSDRYLGRKDGTIMQNSSAIRLGTHTIFVHQYKAEHFIRKGDLIGILGLDAIRRLVMGFPGGSKEVFIGFPINN